MIPLIEQIMMHPAVSRAMQGIGRTPALDCLVRLRKARAEVKRAKANFHEEMAHYHAIAEDYPLGTTRYEMGCIISVPAMPGKRLLMEALTADGLSDDLRDLVMRYLEVSR